MGQEILAQKLVVEFEDRRRVIVGRDDLLHVEPPRGRGPGFAARDGSATGAAGPDLDDLEMNDDDPSEPHQTD